MNDYKIVIDPGHGGVDSGASGNGIKEKDLTLNISKYMYDRFKELGIPVSITRLDDSTISPSDRVNKILSFLWINVEYSFKKLYYFNTKQEFLGGFSRGKFCLWSD